MNPKAKKTEHVVRQERVLESDLLFNLTDDELIDAFRSGGEDDVDDLMENDFEREDYFNNNLGDY